MFCIHSYRGRDVVESGQLLHQVSKQPVFTSDSGEGVEDFVQQARTKVDQPREYILFHKEPDEDACSRGALIIRINPSKQSFTWSNTIIRV